MTLWGRSTKIKERTKQKTKKDGLQHKRLVTGEKYKTLGMYVRMGDKLDH